MFVEKILFGALGGGVLGIVIAIAALFQGKPIGEAGEAFMGCILLGVIVVFWATRNQDSADHGGSRDRNISQLRRDLQTYHRAVSDCTDKGDHSVICPHRVDRLVC